MAQSMPESIGKQKLASFGELWKNTFVIYQKRAKVLWLILLAPFTFSLASDLLSLMPDRVFAKLPLASGVAFLIPLLSIVFFLVAAFFGFWAGIALLFAIKDEISAREAFRQAWQKLNAYVWLAILSTLVIIGGMLLFIAPGIIFSIQFSFIYYILVFEGLKGREAILKSKTYAKGYLGAIFSRQFLFGLAILGIVMVPVVIIFTALSLSPGFGMMASGSGAMTSQQETIINLLMPFIQILIMPLSVIFGFLLYQDVKLKKPDLVFSPTQKQKTGLTLWAVWAMIGWFVIFTFVLGAMIIAWIKLHGAPDNATTLNLILPQLSSLNINPQAFSALINAGSSLWH